MQFAKLFDFEHGQLLVERANGYDPEGGYWYGISLTMWFANGVKPHLQGESYDTPERRDADFEKIDQTLAWLLYGNRCGFLARKFPDIIRPDGSPGPKAFAEGTPPAGSLWSPATTNAD